MTGECCDQETYSLTPPKKNKMDQLLITKETDGTNSINLKKLEEANTKKWCMLFLIQIIFG